MNHKTILMPVIHVQNSAQAVENLYRVNRAGCGFAWLISHGEMNAQELNQLIWDIRQNHYVSDEFGLGVNYLDLSTYEAVTKAPWQPTLQGIWFDDGLPDKPTLAWDCQSIANNKHLITFGSFLFKYQTKKVDRDTEIQTAFKTWNVPTTSGAGTGKAPATEKLTMINETIEPHRLAVASGISLENAEAIKPHIGYALVASSLCKPNDFYNFDTQKIIDLRAILESN